MFKFKKDICELCSDTTMNTFKKFCKEIEMSDADVFIIMAHKAVILYQILLEQNYIDKKHADNKIVISNQALDFNCSYLVGKKIAIIDDIVISGTSIAAVANKLVDIGVKKEDISIIALAIDKDYMAMKFNDSNGKTALLCNTVLSDSTCIELSYLISNMFCFYGIPYNVDFPAYDIINLEYNKYNLLFNGFFWNIHDVTTTNVNSSNNTEYFTLFPHEIMRKRLWNRIGVNLENCVELKVRIFINKYPSGKRDCHITPLCLFKAVSEKNLNKIYDICKPYEEYISLNSDNKAIAMFRFVQFYIAHHLYLLFKDIISLDSDLLPLKKSIIQLFGIIDGNIVYESLESMKYECTDNTPIFEVECTNFDDHQLISDYSNDAYYSAKISSDTKELYKYDFYNINQEILMPFLWWYDTKEIPVRKKLKAEPKHYIDDYKEICNMTNRLNSGFSMPTLISLLSDSLNSYAPETIISLFLDRAIDKGIIVPTVYFDKEQHFLCRAYRHGEDLPFGLADECRLLLFISELCNNISNIDIKYRRNTNSGIASIALEKMIVLFYQMGLKTRNVFNHFLGFDNTKLLNVFLSMHGVVEGFVDTQEMREKNIQKHIYSEEDAENGRYITWLTTWLKEKKYIGDRDSLRSATIPKGLYFINQNLICKFLERNERSCISGTIKKEIENIAQILSIWYNELTTTKLRNFKDDATALTSCANSYVYASAIATEIHYFSKHWTNQIINALDFSIDGENLTDNLSMINENEKEKNWVQIIQQALNSGREKVLWFAKGEAIIVVEEVSKILKKKGAYIWDNIWGNVSTEGSYDLLKASSQLSKLKKFIDQAVGYLWFFSSCYDCIQSIEFWSSGKLPDSYEKYKESYLDCCKGTTLLESNLFEKLYELATIFDFSEKKDALKKLMRNTLINSEDCVKNIDKYVQEKSPNYTIRYKAALILDIMPLKRDYVESVIMEIWDQQDADIKTKLNIIHFSDNLTASDIVRYGFFYGIDETRQNESDSKNECDILMMIYNSLCQKLCGRVYKIYALLIPDTPPGCQFEHNTYNNINTYAKAFNDRIITPLCNHYQRNEKRMFILALTDYVSEEIKFKIEKMGLVINNCIRYNENAIEHKFSQIITFCDDWIQQNGTQEKDITYSLLKIMCDDTKNWGCGLLVRTSEQVICVTCNHVVAQSDENHLTAISSYSDKLLFQIVPFKELVYNDYKKECLQAEDELAILIPQWDGKIPYDIEGIVSLDDLRKCLETDEEMEGEFTCFGYPNRESMEYCWSDSFKVTNRKLRKNYYETIIDPQKENSLCEGYSGGIIINEKSTSKYLGIHEGRLGENRGRMIHLSTIVKKIEEELKNDKE